MLRIPSFRKIGDLTVYQDDGIWSRFTLIPATPTIRRDEKGRPIFLLTIFHTSDQAREANPALARGGGFMNFDVQFAVSEEATEFARRELQQWVHEEYARRRNDPRYASLPEYAAATAPIVEIVDPLLSSGTVSMHTTQSNLLVTGRFAEAPASLVSGSTAVFNLDLTETGAGFMKELFVDSSGRGRVDLTPVQVIYNLKMWARLPPVTITVTGQSERIHQTLKKISQTNRDDPCTPAEVETFRETGTNSSTLRETGMVDVKIDKGDATVPDDVLQALQQYALDLFDTMIAERFLVPAETDTGELDFDADDPRMRDRDPGWGAVLYEGPNFTGRTIEVNEDMSFVGPELNDRISSVRVRAGHRVTLYQHINYGGVSTQLSSSISHLGGNWDKHVSSVKLWRPPTTRYKVRETLNTATMNLQIKVDRSQVVEWPLVGQATLETFFSDASPADIRRHVVELTADQFDSLGVTVRALVDFDKQPVQAIEVQTEYTATDGSGETRTTPGSFTFRSGETAPAKFDPTVLGGKREYRFRYRVIYDDGTASEFTPWEATTNRSLNVTVANAGQLNLEVSGAGLNWDVVRTAEVKLRYGAPADGIATIEKSVQLTKLNPVARWEQQVSKLRGDITAAVTYYLADDKVIDGEARTLDATNTLFVVPPPQADVLNVSLVPSGDWSDVAQAVVSLKYDAGDGRTYDRTFQFKSLDQFAEWAVLLRDPNRRTFQYQTVVAYKGGSDETSPWVTKTGDQAVLINVKGVPKLRINILSNLVDFTRTPVVRVTVSYGEQRQTVSFTGPGASAVQFPVAADGRRDYAYEIVWSTPAGDVSSGVQRSGDTELFIPRAQLPTVGKLDVIVRGFAVDFAATPFVDVALQWQDGNREERKTVTLTKEQPNATWSVDIGDRTQRKYRYAVTYNLADGTRTEGAQGETDDPVVSVTRYRP